MKSSESTPRNPGNIRASKKPGAVHRGLWRWSRLLRRLPGVRRNLAYAGGALVLSVSFLAVALDPKWAFVAAGVLLLFAAWYAAPDSWRVRLLPASWLPPATAEDMQRTWEAKEWGRTRYKFDWRYSEADETIWLEGKPRDEGGGMWCDVRGPDGPPRGPGNASRTKPLARLVEPAHMPGRTRNASGRYGH